MLRFGLLGGKRPSAPWEIFVTLGAALLGAGVLFVFLFPLWSTYSFVGFLEVGGYALAGASLLAVGAIRRKRRFRDA